MRDREKYMAALRTAVVLCVDDDFRALTARRSILSVAGFDVLTADSADAAVRVFRHRSVDVVITDDFLPGGTGAQLAECLKRMDPEVPVVLMSGGAEPPLHSDRA